MVTNFQYKSKQNRKTHYKKIKLRPKISTVALRDKRYVYLRKTPCDSGMKQAMALSRQMRRGKDQEGMRRGTINVPISLTRKTPFPGLNSQLVSLMILKFIGLEQSLNILQRTSDHTRSYCVMKEAV